MKLNTTNANTEKGKFTKDILDFFFVKSHWFESLLIWLKSSSFYLASLEVCCLKLQLKPKS